MLLIFLYLITGNVRNVELYSVRIKVHIYSLLNLLIFPLGVSAGSPTGASWVSLGKAVKDASIGSYGIWVIDNSGILQFARTLPDADLSRSFLRWRDVDGDLKAISAGFGGSLWGILKNGTVVKRENVNSGRPTGTRWMTHDGMTTSVSPGVYEVYRTLSDGTVVKRTGRFEHYHKIL